MKISKDICTVILIAASLAMLAVDYNLLSFSELSITIGALSFSGIKSNSDLLFPISAFAIVLGLCFCHVKYAWYEIAEKFHEGYRESREFVELIRKEISEEARTDRYGSCYGGLKPSFLRKSFDLGKFTTNGGMLTRSVIIEPDSRIHVKGCINGIFRALSYKLWVSVYAPFILGLWALYKIIV
ncbi:MAG: hypothetical protein AABY99_01670 [Pseudomonadota bacterium]